MCSSPFIYNLFYLCLQCFTPASLNTYLTCHLSIWLPLYKCNSHNHYAKWQHRPKILNVCAKIQPNAISSSHVNAMCVPETNISLKYHTYHICKLVHEQIQDNHVNIYASGKTHCSQQSTGIYNISHP